METFILLYFYKNNIFPNLADTFPGDNIFAFSSEETAETSWSGKNQSCEAARFTVEFHINGTTKTFAGADIDDFFLL